MPNTNGQNYAIFAAIPPGEVSVQQWGGRIRAATEKWAYAAQASGDTLTGPVVDANMVPIFYQLLTSTGTGTTTISGGFAGAAAAIFAAAAFTNADVPVNLGKAAAIGDVFGSLGLNLLPATSPDQAPIILTTGVGALPGAGSLRFTCFYIRD